MLCIELTTLLEFHQVKIFSFYAVLPLTKALWFRNVHCCWSYCINCWSVSALRQRVWDHVMRQTLLIPLRISLKQKPYFENIWGKILHHNSFYKSPKSPSNISWNDALFQCYFQKSFCINCRLVSTLRYWIPSRKSLKQNPCFENIWRRVVHWLEFFLQLSFKSFVQLCFIPKLFSKVLLYKSQISFRITSASLGSCDAPDASDPVPCR